MEFEGKKAFYLLRELIDGPIYFDPDEKQALEHYVEKMKEKLDFVMRQIENRKLLKRELRRSKKK
jgi:hypothetical protein